MENQWGGSNSGAVGRWGGGAVGREQQWGGVSLQINELFTPSALSAGRDAYAPSAPPFPPTTDY